MYKEISLLKCTYLCKTNANIISCAQKTGLLDKDKDLIRDKKNIFKESDRKTKSFLQFEIFSVFFVHIGNDL